MSAQLAGALIPDPTSWDASLSLTGVVIIVVIASALGLVWAFVSYLGVKKIDLKNGQQGEYENLNNEATEHQIKLLLELGEKISEGAKEFLKQEYLVCIIFVGVMFFIIYGAVEKFQRAYTAFAFAIGAVTSIACGAIGMTIATYTNYRVTYCAKRGLADAFRTAYRGGCVMGFALVSIALVTLMLLILIYKAIMGLENNVLCILDECEYYSKLFESIAGYGLGGSTVALFGRVGGGIYTKAADVGADLVGKVEKDLPEDSPKNPATIADNVGDNVGDIAGMGADLFGSFAESTCAALVISANSLFALTDDLQPILPAPMNLISINNLMFPLTMIAFGIVVCLITSAIGIFINNVDVAKKIESTLKYQIIISTVLLLGAIYLAAHLSYPANFYVAEPGAEKVARQPYHAYLCAVFGLVSGMIIGGFTEFMTSHTYGPVRELAGSCKTGAATNVIYGLALGYLSTIVPVVCIALTAYGSSKFLGYYGVALGALGMLSNLPIGLAIDGYGPISDNAGGIAEMAEMGEEVRTRTDSLDAAGNTTAAIGKGFAIGSAALVALSLYGGFLHNSNLTNGLSLTDPSVFAGLLIGAMLPYAFSAFTMKSVGKAALGMVEEIRKQIRENPGILTGTVEPDYKACIRISTRASLIEMIAPGCLVTAASISGPVHTHASWYRLRAEDYCWFLARSHRIGCAARHFGREHRRCLGQRQEVH